MNLACPLIVRAKPSNEPPRGRAALVTDETLNAGFFVIHTAWIAFNCVGWVSSRTRRLQLVTVLLTAFSWFGLGIWFGWGYCPCTDWHWRVRARLGYHDPPSYIQLLVRELSGIDLGPGLANGLAVGTLAVVAVLSAFLGAHDRRVAGVRDQR